MSHSEIKQGHVLDVLKGMESESVQCVITSPPYYGLRSYGTEPQVWGNHNGCSHAWGDAIKYAKEDKRTPEQKAAQGAVVGNSVNSIGFAVGNSGNFCLSCNAWRGELGLEPNFTLYISHLIEIFAEVKRVLKRDGTCWVNLGDSYASSGVKQTGRNDEGTRNGEGRKAQGGGAKISIQMDNPIECKSLMNIPARFAIAMTDELKMIQRNQIIWYKRACMPSSAKDRFTVDFESIFFFSKEPRYKFNQQLEPLADVTKNDGRFQRGEWATNGRPNRDYVGSPQNCTNLKPTDGDNRNKRCVWDVPFEPSKNKHYASYPTKLVEPMILAGTDEGDTVLDIFNGTGTTGITAIKHRRNYIGIELQPDYVDITRERFQGTQVSLI